MTCSTTPLELRNQVEAPDQADVLRQMRGATTDCSPGRSSCIQANQYPAFLASADRTVPGETRPGRPDPLRARLMPGIGPP